MWCNLKFFISLFFKIGMHTEDRIVAVCPLIIGLAVRFPVHMSPHDEVSTGKTLTPKRGRGMLNGRMRNTVKLRLKSAILVQTIYHLSLPELSFFPL